MVKGVNRRNSKRVVYLRWEVIFNLHKSNILKVYFFDLINIFSTPLKSRKWPYLCFTFHAPLFTKPLIFYLLCLPSDVYYLNGGGSNSKECWGGKTIFRKKTHYLFDNIRIHIVFYKQLKFSNFQFCVKFAKGLLRCLKRIYKHILPFMKTMFVSETYTNRLKQ